MTLNHRRQVLFSAVSHIWNSMLHNFCTPSGDRELLARFPADSRRLRHDNDYTTPPIRHAMTNCTTSVFLCQSGGHLNGQLSSDQWPAASMTTVTGDLSADGQPSVGASFLGASSTVIDPDGASTTTTTKRHTSFLLDHRRGDDAPSVTGDDRRQ